VGTDCFFQAFFFFVSQSRGSAREERKERRRGEGVREGEEGGGEEERRKREKGPGERERGGGGRLVEVGSFCGTVKEVLKCMSALNSLMEGGLCAFTHCTRGLLMGE
jgi:hypothetical protein